MTRSVVGLNQHRDGTGGPQGLGSTPQQHWECAGSHREKCQGCVPRGDHGSDCGRAPHRAAWRMAGSLTPHSAGTPSRWSWASTKSFLVSEGLRERGVGG